MIRDLFLSLQGYYHRRQADYPGKQATNEFIERASVIITEIRDYAQEHPEEVKAATRSMMYLHGSTPIETIIALMNTKLRIAKRGFRASTPEVCASTLLDIIDLEKLDRLPPFIKERLDIFRARYLELERTYTHS